MAEELKIKEQKQVVCNGFVQYSQEVVELAKQGYVLDIRNKTSPNFMLGLFTCSMLLLEDEADANIIVPLQVDNPVNKMKPKRAYTKKDEIRAQLSEKLGEQSKSIR